MPSPLEDAVWNALKSVKYPGMNRDIVSFGFVRTVQIDGAAAIIELEMSTQNPKAAEEVRGAAEKAATSVDGISAAEARLKISAPPGRQAQQATAQDPDLLPGVRHVIAVASGKGGVGKSTVASNLAVRLGQLGHRVGLLDADIYGPSVPTMFGIDQRPQVDGQSIVPFEKHGIRLMSLGFVVDADTPVIWRGPMVMKALMQLLGEVSWGALDFLIIDLPPGTGDAQLTLTQKVPLSGAVIVSTPQDVALIDARKGLQMFRKVNVPVIGIIENMSGFVCPCCGERTDVFKKGGGARTAETLGCPFLGEIPLDPSIMQGGDSGEPITAQQTEGPHADAFRRVAEAVVAQVEKAERPSLTIV